METCKYCGYSAEHDPAVCKVLIADKDEKPKVKFTRGRKMPVIKHKDQIKLLNYLKGK